MAHTKYTGKSAPVVVDWGTLAGCHGWRKITIAEKGAPATEQIDTTVAADTSYAFTDDPLGGKGSASSTVTVEGFLSELDNNESGFTTLTIGGTETIIITKKASGDEWTADMVVKSFTTEAGIGVVVPFTVTFENTTSPGAWSTDVP
jgi:hypothetical protein